MNRELNKDKAVKLYNNLIKRGLSEKNIGPKDKFVENLSSEDNAIKLYGNLKKSSKTSKAFKYSQDDFLNNLYTNVDDKKPIEDKPKKEVVEDINNVSDTDIKYLNSLDPNAINQAVSFGTEKNIINTQDNINSINSSVDSALNSANKALKNNRFSDKEYIPTEEDIKIQKEYDAANDDVKFQLDAINAKREEDKKKYNEITNLYENIEDIDNAIAQKEQEIKDYLIDKEKTRKVIMPRMGGYGGATMSVPAYSPEVEAEWGRLSREKQALELQKDFLHSYKQLEDYDNAEEKWGFLRGLFKTGKFSEFATLGVAEMVKDIKFLNILKRADKGEKLTNNEQKAVAMYNKLQDMQGKDRGFWFESGRGLQYTLQFMLGIMASGGIGGSMKGITQAGVKQGLKMAAKGAVDGLMKTPIMPAMYKNFTNREVQDYKMSFNPEKAGFDIEKSSDANGFANFYKAFAETWAERFTESLGNIIDDFGLMSKVFNNKATRKVFGNAMDKMAKLSKNPIYSNTNIALRKMGVNDIPTEMFEEIINVPLQSALLWENQFEQLADKEFYANVALHSFLLGGMGNVMRYTAGGAGYAIERHNINKQFEANTNLLNSAAIKSNDANLQNLVNRVQQSIVEDKILNEEGEIENTEFLDAYAELDLYINDNNIDGVKKPLQDFVKIALAKKGETLSMEAYVKEKIGFDFVGPDNKVHIITLNSDKKDGNQYYLVDRNESGIVLVDVNNGEKKIVKQDEISKDISFDRGYYVEELFFDNIIGFQAERQNELLLMMLEDEKAERDNNRAVAVDFEGNRYNVVHYENGIFKVVDDSGNYLDIDEHSVSPVFEDDIIAEQTELDNEIKEAAQANGIELPKTENVTQQQETEEIAQEQQQELPEDNENKPQYPIDESGNPLFEQMSVDDAINVIDELGDYGDKLIDNNINSARKAYEKASKRQPKSTTLNEMKAEMQEIENAKESAKNSLAMWENIKKAKSARAITKTKNIESVPKADIKANEVGTNIKEKWNSAPKVVGNEVTRTLQDGTVIKGRYVLAPANAVTPSHNPDNFYNNNEGFPVNEKGQNINDRDYHNDKNAQQETEKIARSYAGQAIENVPVISPDGVVYDGNGRVMAGQIAANNGTDTAYLEALNANLGNFGFEQSQLDDITHPRLYFVLDETLPYTTETFAKFNQQDKKTLSSTERAVSKGKNLSNKAVGEMLSIVDSYDTLQSFFVSPSACGEIIKSLLNNGIISSAEVASLTEKDKNGDDILSVNGREFVTDVLIGATFNEDTIRKIGNDKSLKQSVLRALNTIIENRKLGEYTLTDEISRAINLLYEAKKSKMPLSLYMKQGNIFELPIEERYNPIDVLLAEQFESGVEDFREVIRLYNELASLSAGGQIDMFSGEILTEEQLINEILNRYGKSEQQTERIDNRGKESTPIEIGDTENERGRVEERATEEINNVDDLIDKARAGNKDAINKLNKYGIPYTNSRVYRFVGQSEVDALLEKGEIVSQSASGVIDVTSSENVTTAQNSEYRITFKDSMDFDKQKSDTNRAVMKNSELGDGWISNGKYSLDEVEKIEKINKDGNYEVVYDSNNSKQVSNVVEPQEINVESVFGNLYDKKQTKLSDNIEQARSEVEQNPTEAQKEAGNYKKGHITIDGHNVTIENPKGSIRSGKDKNGAEWSVTMNNDYGYIRMTEGIDGDHIDVFLSDKPDEGDVYVVDQVNENGEFDEHKVMYGFNSYLSAKRAYLSNYSKDWKGLGNITKVSKEDFKKWVNSSKRKSKPFAEYTIAKKDVDIENNNTHKRIISEERYKEVREQLRKELSQLNMGLNPKIMILAAEAAIYHIENGAYKFVDFAKKVIKDFGEEIRPYLKSMYNSARDYPGMESIAEKMDDYNVVKKIDINSLNTAEDEHNRGRNQQENPELGREKQQEVGRSKRTRVDRSNDGNSLFDQIGSARVAESANINETAGLEEVQTQTEVKAPVSLKEEKKEEQTSVVKNANNNRDSINDNTPSTVTARYKANIAAIRLMKELISTDKKATKEQMAILKQYSGWGGLGGYFKDNTGAELRELLSDEEYESALGSVSSAYYTPSNIISSLWKIAERLGFKGGNILEGSAGIGNILGLIPENINGKSDITAIEKDTISGNILKLLYPDANVQVSGFEDVNVRNGSIDLAITNVPFITGYSVFDNVDKDLSKKFKNIHDFCIAKNVRKLREGGIGIFITTKATMDKSNALREWITSKGNADFIGAFRLNNDTFKGANVTSDIIIIRKRVNGKKSNSAVDVSTVMPVRTYPFNTGESKFNKKAGEWQDVIKELVMEYNGYFVNNPNNMAGEMAFGAENGDTFRPESTNLYPLTSIDQQEMLDNFVKSIENKDSDITSNSSVEENVLVDDSIYKTGSLILNSKGQICTYKNGSVIPLDINDNKVKGKAKTEVLNDYKSISEALNKVLNYQLKNSDDAGLQVLLDELNNAYDTFVKKYGTLNKNTSISFLRKDIDFPLIASIEKYEEYKDIDGTKHINTTKTEVFNKRVLGVKVAPKPTNVKDGVISSMYLYNCIDVSYIANQLGITEDDVRKEIISSGLGFENPISGNVEVKYEYLSGNVREKLTQAEANNENGKYNNNIEELKKVIPMDVPTHLIEITLGSTWVDSSLFSDFLKDKYGVSATFNNVGSVWSVSLLSSIHNEKNIAGGVRSKMFNELITADRLVTAAINNKTIEVKKVVKDYYSNTSTTQSDKEATEACTARIQEIKDEFKEWIRERLANDAELSNRLEKIYNERFNGYVPKKIDDIFLPNKFEGANLNYDLYLHQKQAVIRGLSEPLLLAHEVGTGKTFSLISTAMEMKRLGTAKKPMIVVQDSTVGQFVTECKKLYPNAKVLTISDNDRTPEGRREFYGRIKYNSWDIIVIPQSTFNKIPDSPERKSKFIQDKIDDVEYMLDALMGDDSIDRGVIQDLEKQIKELKEDLSDIVKENESKEVDKSKNAKLINNTIVKAKAQLDRNSDDVQYFEDMGIDALLIDEAHEYKKLGFTTSMTRGVKGIDPKGSKRAASLFLKTRAILESNGGKNVIFATGTPISNTAAEIWTFMRYLMPKDVMLENDIYYFDDFVHNFGNINKYLEFATNGSFKENTRFAAYSNVPELIRFWSMVSDTVLSKKTLDDKVPKISGEKAQDIFLEQSQSLINIMAAVRSELKRFEEMSGKEKKKNSHIPITMYGMAKRAAIDARLVDSNAVDEPNSKTNKAVEYVVQKLKDTDRYKGTIAIFCDNHRRWSFVGGKKVCDFELFDEIANKLIEKGVPANQIAIMRGGMSIAKKEKLFSEVNAGNVRVILGTTQTLGTGVNIQERLASVIHMDAPDRPMDYTQRNGRILRQGNLHKQWDIPVDIIRFGVEDSLDVTAYQRLKTKSQFIDSIMNGNTMLVDNQNNRTLEEEEEGLFDNPVAILSGSEYAQLKNKAERDLRKYKNKLQQYNADQAYVNTKIKQNKNDLEVFSAKLEDVKEQKEKTNKYFPNKTYKSVEIEGVKCNNDAQIEKAFKDIVNKSQLDYEAKVREDRYFNGPQTKYISIKIDNVTAKFKRVTDKTQTYDQKLKLWKISVTTKWSYSIPELGIEDALVSGKWAKDGLTEILNDVITQKSIDEDITYITNRIQSLQENTSIIKERLGKPFEYIKELEAAQQNVDKLTELMREEMKKKEEKYANAITNSVDVNSLNNEDEVEDSSEEKEDSSASYEVSNRQVDSSTNTTNAVLEMLGNAGVDVEIVSQEDFANLGNEENEIITKAKANGTYLKAPNGKDTKLTPKQWVQVRTKAFIKWFGDWEKAFRIKKLRNSKPVVISGNEYKGKYELNRESIKSWINNNLRGEYKIDDTSETILLSRVGENKVTSHGMGNDAHLKSIICIPSLIKNAIFIEERNNEKNNGKFKSYRYYVIGLKIGDIDYTVKLTVGVDKMGNKYYDHSLTEIEKVKLLDLIEDQAVTLSDFKTTGNISVPSSERHLKDKRLISILQNNFSKELDENGEPLETAIYNDDSPQFSIRKEEAPKNIGIGYKVFYKGKAGREPQKRQLLKTPNGIIYGAAYNGKIYLNKDVLNSNTPIHEYTHLWDATCKEKNPELWNKGKELMKQTTEWQEVMNDSNYSDIHNDEDKVASEVHSRLTGKRGEEKLNELQRNIEKKGFFKTASLIADLKKWLNDFWFWVKDTFANWSKEDIDRVSLDDFINMPISDLAKGVNPTIVRNRNISYNIIGNEENSTMPDNYISNDIEYTIEDKFREKAIDSLQSVRKLQEEIEQRGIEITEEADPYSQSLLSSSIASAEFDKFNSDIFQPLIKKIVDMANILTKKGFSKLTIKGDIIDYLYARHAIERNRKICLDEITDSVYGKLSVEEKTKLDTIPDLKALVDDVITNIYDSNFSSAAPLSSLDLVKRITFNEDAEAMALWSLLNARINKAFKKIKKNGNNRSGMTDEKAREIINKMYTSETSAMFDELQGMIKQSTDFTLDKWLEYGLISKSQYDSYKNMYEYYIPLRNWEEKEDIDYNNLANTSYRGTGDLVNMNKAAKGRKSKAANPLVFIANMAQSAVVVGNKNRVRRCAFNLVSENADKISDLAIIEKAYLIEDGYGSAHEQFTKPTQQQIDNGEVIDENTDSSYRWHKTNAELNAHQVSAMIDGQKYIITFKGELGARAAGAISGANSIFRLPDSLSNATRFLSAGYTSANPYFMFRNLFRDMQFGFALNYLNRGILDTGRLSVNYIKAFKTIHRDLVGKNGTAIDAVYEDFKLNGGKTGYIYVYEMQKLQNSINRDLRKASGEGNFIRISWDKLMDIIGTCLNYMGEMSENAMRFASYRTAIESGASQREAALRAKEATVNFNRKGSSSNVLGALYVFFNASVQGTYTLARAIKHNPYRAGALISALAGLSFVSTLLCSMSGGDDDDSFDRISDFQKQTNFMLPLGSGKYFAIPYGQGLRVFSNIGYNIAQYTLGKKDEKEVFNDMFWFGVGDFAPFDIEAIDFKGEDIDKTLIQAFSPSVVRPLYEVTINRNFMGLPIYREPFMKTDNDYTPRYKYANKNTSDLLVSASKYLNMLAGGTDYLSARKQIDDKGNVVNSNVGELLDINPAKVEHIAKGIVGGRFSFPKDIANVFTSLVSGEFGSEKIDFINMFIKTPTQKPGYKEYYQLRNEVRDIEKIESIIKKESAYGEESSVYFMKNQNNYLKKSIYDSYSKVISNITNAISILPKTKEYEDETKRLEDLRDNLIKECAEKYKNLNKENEKDR